MTNANWHFVVPNESLNHCCAVQCIFFCVCVKHSWEITQKFQSTVGLRAEPMRFGLFGPKLPAVWLPCHEDNRGGPGWICRELHYAGQL